MLSGVRPRLQLTSLRTKYFTLQPTSLYSAIPLYSETRVSMTDALSPASVAPSRCRTCEYPAWNVDISDEEKHIFVLSCSEMYVYCFD
jgi:hypothetical protein